MTYQFVQRPTQTQFTQFMLQPTENRDSVIPHFSQIYQLIANLQNRVFITKNAKLQFLGLA